MIPATPHPPVSGPWPAPRLRALQVEEMFRFAGVSAAYSYFGALLTLGVLFEVSADHRTPAAAWFVAATLLAVLRGILVVAYKRRPAGSDPSRYARFAIGANFLAGVLWGVLGTALFPAGPVYAQLFVVMVIICFVAGSVTAYSAVEGAHEALSIPATLPTAAYLFFMRDGMHWYAGVAALFFCFAIIYYARQLHTHLEAGFLAQIERGDLLSLSSAVNEKISTENRDLAHRVAVRGMSVASAREQVDRLESLFESSPLPWLVCDEVGRVLRANAAADRLFARGSGGLDGAAVTSILPGLALRAGEVSSGSATAGGTAVDCVAHVWPWSSPAGGRGFGVVLTQARQAVLS